MKKDNETLPRTRLAIVEYDAGASARYAQIMSAKTNDGFWAAMMVERAEADKVREAFAQDTREINTKDKAFLIHPDDPWLRRLLAKNRLCTKTRND